MDASSLGSGCGEEDRRSVLSFRATKKMATRPCCRPQNTSMKSRTVMSALWLRRVTPFWSSGNTGMAVLAGVFPSRGWPAVHPVEVPRIPSRLARSSSTVWTRDPLRFRVFRVAAHHLSNCGERKKKRKKRNRKNGCQRAEQAAEIQNTHLTIIEGFLCGQFLGAREEVARIGLGKDVAPKKPCLLARPDVGLHDRPGHRLLGASWLKQPSCINVLQVHQTPVCHVSGKQWIGKQGNDWKAQCRPWDNPRAANGRICRTQSQQGTQWLRVLPPAPNLRVLVGENPSMKIPLWSLSHHWMQPRKSQRCQMNQWTWSGAG